MTDRDFWWKISIVAGLLAVGFAAVYPIERNIKLGIDLSGGYSLLYEIDDTGIDASQRKELSAKVISILKERVDPNGVLNLVWRPVGYNRLEIQMPRPPAKVGEARDKYRQVQVRVLATTIRKADVSVALSRPPAERDKALEELVRGVPKRRELFAKLVKAHDALKAAEAGTDDDAVKKAEDQYNEAFAAVLATSIDVGRLETAIESDPRKPFRAKELEELKKNNPDLSPLITEAQQAYDDWRGLRGKSGTLDDPADLQRLLHGAGVLEFRLLPTLDPSDPTQFDRYVQQLQKRGPRSQPGDRFGWFQIDSPSYFFKSKNLDTEFESLKRRFCIAERYGDKYYVLAYLDPSKSLTQDQAAGAWELKNAQPTRDEEGRPAVAFTLDERGGNRFLKLTSENKQKQLCFFLDGMAVSAATIQSPIRTQGRITGSFTPQEVQQLCQKLSAGSLPRKLKEPPISVHGIGPSLGQANREAGQRAALYGCLAVAIFMIIYYHYSGAIAVFALTLNLLLTGAVIATLNATLNLPGIAGMVLAVGMAVDANVLINERIREELHRGVGMRQAIKLGYERAFSAIIDSHVTTILTSAILYWIGSEEIRGFGLTLGWGVVISLLTAVYVTRIFFEYMDSPRIGRDVWEYPLVMSAITAAVGGGLWALGYWLNPPELRAESVIIFFGKMLTYFLPATLLVIGMMSLVRVIHKRAQARNPNDLPMLHLIKVYNIDWYSKRRIFYVVSGLTTTIGLLIFLARPDKDKYDIEFLGGTSAQIDFKPGHLLTDTEVAERLKSAADGMDKDADKIAQGRVSARNGLFVVDCKDVPSDRLASIMRVQFADQIRQGGVTLVPDHPGEVQISMKDEAKIGDKPPTVDTVQAQLKPAASRLKQAAKEIEDSQVQAVHEGTENSEKASSFEIVTRETSRELVVDAIMSKMRSDLDILPSLTYELKKDVRRGGVNFFPVTEDDLGKVIGDPKVAESVGGFRGGVAMVLDRISPPETAASVDKRIRDMRLQPGHSDVGWRQQKVIGLTPAGREGGETTYSRIAIVVSDETYAYEEGGASNVSWRDKFAEPEVKLAQDALTRETSLGKVTQFNPQVADESKMRAYTAMAASWFMIVMYLWFRFGSASWGVAAVIALIHDVLVALGFVAGAYLLCGPALNWLFGKILLVEPFRIDMAVVAAMMTVIGYSVSDTIVVFDRIRENRGKMHEVTPQLVNASVNQTMSRTLLTVFTVLMTIVIMYCFGGRGIHGFNYAMLIGTLTGCYSSIFVASPILVYLQKRAATVRA